MGGMAWIRKTYDVPAKRGMRVLYTGNGRHDYGTITSARDGRIYVLIDGDKHPGHYHPKWKMAYGYRENEGAP